MRGYISPSSTSIIAREVLISDTPGAASLLLPETQQRAPDGDERAILKHDGAHPLPVDVGAGGTTQVLQVVTAIGIAHDCMFSQGVGIGETNLAVGAGADAKQVGGDFQSAGEAPGLPLEPD